MEGDKKLENPSIPAQVQEIEDIMSEIEGLQTEMSAVEATLPSAGQAEVDAALQGEALPEQPSQVVAEDTLAEFRSGAAQDGISMEETLAEMKVEPASGPTLLDGAEIGPQGSSEASAVTEIEESQAQFDDISDEELALLQANYQATQNAEAEGEAMSARPAPTLAVVPPPHSQQSQNSYESIAPLPTPSPTSPSAEEATSGALTLTLSGTMTLRLKYEFEGQEVTVSFENEALKVMLTDGTEFKVPVHRMARRKVA